MSFVLTGICGVYGCGVDLSELVSETNPLGQKCFSSLEFGLGSCGGKLLEGGKNALAFDGRLYNQKKLGRGKSASDAAFGFLEKHGVAEFLEQADGDYALCFRRGLELFLARDPVGVRPLWYCFLDRGLVFASEKKFLKWLGAKPVPLLPGEILCVSGTKKSRERIRLSKVLPRPVELKKAFVEAVLERSGGEKIALLFSGGVDSSLLAKVLKDNGVDFTCFVAGTGDSEDPVFAEKMAKEMGLELQKVLLDEEKLVRLVPRVSKTIEDDNHMKVSVATPFYACCEVMEKQGFEAVFSGLGSEEVFAGYERHVDAFRENRLRHELWLGLENMWERDIYRDYCVCAKYGLEPRLPFLDFGLLASGLAVPPEEKIGEFFGQTFKKKALRQAALDLGVPKEACVRKKKAAQYGSGVDKALRKIAKKEGYKDWEFQKFVSALGK